MTKLPNWIEVKELKVVGNKLDWYVNAEIKVKYIPLRLLTNFIIKFIGWRFWLYPVILSHCLDKIGFVIPSPDI